MHLVRTNNAEKDFEELLSAAWAAQVTHLRARPDSGELQVDPDSQKRPGNKETSDEHENR